MDSILKTVGGVYSDLFATVALQMYSDAFLASDERNRQALLKVLNTWRYPGLPRLSSVLPIPVLDQIDSFVRSVPKVLRS
jgi:hypothetical protein